MSLSGTFNPAPSNRPAPPPRGPRPAPFSLRLNAEERERLIREAGGAPLGAYIKAKVLGDASPVRTRRSGLPVEDRKALAQALALLGNAKLSSNLNQLARLAHVGALPLSPDTEAELLAALRDVRSVRALLLSALGLKSDDAGERP